MQSGEIWTYGWKWKDYSFSSILGPRDTEVASLGLDD